MKKDLELQRKIEREIQRKKINREKISRVVRDANEDEIREIVKNADLNSQHFAYIINMLVNCKAILKGHFELRSGGHSSTFLQFARIAGYPEYLERISKMLAHLFWDIPITAILSPITIGGLYGQSVARELDVRQLRLAELVNDKPAVPHNSLTIEQGERVLIVNDLTTTARGILSLHSLVKACEAETIGVGLFACRYPKGIVSLKKILETEGIPMDNIHALIELHTDYADGKESCPRCAKDEEYVNARLLI